MDIEMVTPADYDSLCESMDNLRDQIQNLKPNPNATEMQKARFSTLRVKALVRLGAIDQLVINMGDTEIVNGGDENVGA